MKEVMPEPSEEQWKAIAEDFWNIWNFPNFIRAVDGKHVIIEETFSVVFLALVDATTS
jgi:hypothetical protein